MAQPKTILLSVFAGGGRTSRFGDCTLVLVPNMAFATTTQEFNMAERWARSRPSTGNAQRDRTLFTDRMETMLARNGCGLATKGSKPTLRTIIGVLKQSGQDIKAWSVPHNINESMEATPRKKPAEDGDAKKA